MSLLKQKQPQLNSALRKKIKFSVREEDYNQKWYIYELANSFNDAEGVDATEDASQAEFVSTLLGSLSTGTNIVNIYLKAAKWFTDDDTGEEGVINISRDSIRRVGTPDIDSYLSKFIFKENIDAYTNKQFPTRNRVFFAMREKPNPTGADVFKLRYEEVYLIYDYEDIFNDDTDSTYAQTKLTFLRFDSNVARNGADNYLEVNFWLGGVVPSADSIKFRPTTLAALAPNPFELVDNNNLNLNGEYSNDPDNNNSLARWLLEHIGFKKPEGSFNFAMYSYMMSEYKGREEMSRAIKKSNIIENSITLNTGNFTVPEGSTAGGDEYFLKNQQYNFITVNEIAGLGAGKFEDDFLNATIYDWYTGGFDGSLTQLGQDILTREEGVAEGLFRNKENWSSQSRWWLCDIWYGTSNIVIESFEGIDYTTPKQNDLVFNSSYLPSFANDFWLGNASIDGVNPTLSFTNPIEQTFINDLNTVESDYGMCLVNFGNQTLREKAYDEVSFSYKEIDISKQFISKNPRMKIPNLADSLGAGVRIKKELFSGKDTAPSYEPEKSAFIYSWGSVQQISSIKIKGIFGRFYLTWLANGELATGVNTEGQTITIPETLYRGPQEISTPDATEIQITFIA